MEINWSYVKQQTLWNYDELLEKLQKVLTYRFVLEYYDHSMKDAKVYATKVQQGYLQGREDVLITTTILENFDRLEELHVGTYLHLVKCVKTKGECEAFLQSTKFKFESLIQTLNYLFRWVLPCLFPLREFFDVDDPVQKSVFGTLKSQKLVSNLDLLEIGRKKDGRAMLSQNTGLPETILLSLVHKADISRLAYVRGKTVNHLCGGGYNTLVKIANADLEIMDKDMDAYYQTLGKNLVDFQSVILLPWIIGGAQILPRVMEE